MDDIVFTTERLALRLWRDEDQDRVTAMRTPAVQRWLEDDDMPRTGSGTQMEWARGMQAALGHCYWIVERRADGEVLGYCGLKHVDADGTSLTGAFEAGWTFGEAHWGRGYATEAARGVLHRAFSLFDAPRVCAFTVIGNVPSMRVMERIGMTRRADLDFHDPAYSAALNPTIVYMIERDQWEAAA